MTTSPSSISPCPGRSGRLRSRHRQTDAGREPLRYLIERLEDRTLLAFNLALSTSPTVNVTSSTTSNTTTYTAIATGANLNWIDVWTQINGGRSIVISSGSTGSEAGNITDQTGMLFDSATAPNLSLTIQSGSGPGLVGNISIISSSMTTRRFLTSPSPPSRSIRRTGSVLHSVPCRRRLRISLPIA